MRTLAILLSLASSLAADSVRDGAFLGEFVAAKESIAPGETIDIALRIRHDPGFHTYWKAPGIVGVATNIDWLETSGLTPAEILWPQPQTIKMGPYTAYGYEKETLLVVPVTAPHDAKAGTTAKLLGKASFMICPAVITETESCYPGFVDLELEIPITKKPGAATKWQKSIAAARETFAKPNAAWDATAVRSGAQISLNLRPRDGAELTPPKTFYFYSADATIHSDKAQSVTRHADGSITLTMTRSEFAPKGTERLEGILYTATGLPDGSGAVPVFIAAPYEEKP